MARCDYLYCYFYIDKNLVAVICIQHELFKIASQRAFLESLVSDKLGIKVTFFSWQQTELS